MRLLLATDGTPGALTAVDLVAGLRWPSDLVVDVVAVVDAGAPAAFAFSPVHVVHGYDEERTASALATAREATARLGRHGIMASARVLHGREADAIVQRAVETEASLIVCGSRGHGPLRSKLLGSVSAEVAQRAPCSVLVARHPTIAGVTLATDGSAPSLAAEHLVMRLPLFAQTSIDVVTVTDLLTDPDDAHASRLRHVVELQHEATERLRRCGRTVNEVLLTGDPAHEIVEAAQRAQTDLIVMGTHGRSGLDRLLLGSVARDVLVHSHASILVAREPVVQPQRGGGSRVRIEPVASIRLRSMACA